MDGYEGCEVAVDWFWGDGNDHSWAYIREAGLDFPLVFPEMLGSPAGCRLSIRDEVVQELVEG